MPLLQERKTPAMKVTLTPCPLPADGRDWKSRTWRWLMNNGWDSEAAMRVVLTMAGLQKAAARQETRTYVSDRLLWELQSVEGAK